MAIKILIAAKLIELLMIVKFIMIEDDIEDETLLRNILTITGPSTNLSIVYWSMAVFHDSAFVWIPSVAPPSIREYVLHVNSGISGGH